MTLITRIRGDHRDELKTNFPPAIRVIDRLLEIGWLQRIPVDSPARSSLLLYLVDMEAVEGEQPDVYEVLQGTEPRGFICHFGAIAFHGLTTQVPSYYHIAVMNQPQENRPAFLADDLKPEPDHKAPRSLGTLLFDYQGIPCFSTRRDPTLVPGIQQRILGPRTRLRITTVEQTMLDALMHPSRCGGEAVVFETWERGMDRWDPSRMEKHLAAMKREDLERRVGAMLDLMDITEAPAPLAARLTARKKACQASPDTRVVSLLQGVPYTHVCGGWRVAVPS